MFDWFKDGVNPRGPEYGATARAARNARRSADAAEDLLELELSANCSATARNIIARREREANRRAFWHRVDLVLSLAFVAFIAWLIFAPASNAPQSAVTREAPAHVSKEPLSSRAPVRQAQAPDSSGSDAYTPTAADEAFKIRDQKLHPEDYCNGDGNHPSWGDCPDV